MSTAGRTRPRSSPPRLRFRALSRAAARVAPLPPGSSRSRRRQRATGRDAGAGNSAPDAGRAGPRSRPRPVAAEARRAAPPTGPASAQSSPPSRLRPWLRLRGAVARCRPFQTGPRVNRRPSGGARLADYVCNSALSRASRQATSSRSATYAASVRPPSGFASTRSHASATRSTHSRRSASTAAAASPAVASAVSAARALGRGGEPVCGVPDLLHDHVAVVLAHNRLDVGVNVVREHSEVT
jgi:hypothetical protein